MAYAPAEPPRVPAALPRPRTPVASLLVLVVIAATGVSFYGTEFDLIELFAGAGPIERFASGMFPPDLSAATLRSTGRGIFETFQMSLLGAVLGIVAAFPLALIATGEAATTRAALRTRVLQAIPYHAARLGLNVFRSVPEILWALVFVVALGLGPFPGTVALAIHSTGVFGKLFSEQLESVPARPVEALRAIGATRTQRLLFGRLPQAGGGFVSLGMYQWECNIRAATILGFVGAGGIGQQILISMQLFDYQKVATLALATIITVLAVDRVSAAARRRLSY